MHSTLSHLECSRTACAETLSPTTARNLCPSCRSPLLARYDLDLARETLTLGALARRTRSMWRYAEVLPDARAAVPGAAPTPERRSAQYASGTGTSRRDVSRPVTLGEGMTPLIHARRLGEQLGLERLFIKDEGLNPTGSFKARGLSAAVSMAKALGAAAIALPTAGNAGGAAAAYAATAGIGCVIAMPTDTPVANVIESRAFGADVRMIDGLIFDCGRYIAERATDEGWFEVSTLKEPYRIEGKKTMGYELWEEFGGELPDVIVYPTGGGVGLIGMWKAFEELGAMGLVGTARPRMISAQAQGCAPIVRAFEQGATVSEYFEDAETVASGLRVPKALGDFLILDGIYASGGEAIAASDAELMEACRDMARLEGIFTAPEGGAGLVAVQKLAASGRIGTDETVVLFNTGSGYKYEDAWQAALAT